VYADLLTKSKFLARYNAIKSTKSLVYEERDRERERESANVIHKVLTSVNHFPEYSER